MEFKLIPLKKSPYYAFKVKKKDRFQNFKFKLRTRWARKFDDILRELQKLELQDWDQSLQLFKWPAVGSKDWPVNKIPTLNFKYQKDIHGCIKLVKQAREKIIHFLNKKEIPIPKCIECRKFLRYDAETDTFKRADGRNIKGHLCTYPSGTNNPCKAARRDKARRIKSYFNTGSSSYQRVYRKKKLD